LFNHIVDVLTILLLSLLGWRPVIPCDVYLSVSLSASISSTHLSGCLTLFVYVSVTHEGETPPARSSHTMTVVEGDIIIYGGYSLNEVASDFYRIKYVPITGLLRTLLLLFWIIIMFIVIIIFPFVVLLDICCGSVLVSGLLT